MGEIINSGEGRQDPVWLRLLDYEEDCRELDLLHFLYKGLIFPKEDSLMLRCRMTGGEMSSDQLMGLASFAELYGGGYADITTRANFQIREIDFEDGINVLRELLKLDIVPAAPGLNNLRNITITPTSGFDVTEVADVSQLAQTLTDALLFNPALEGLPGKFNIALDSGGSVSVASEANDMGLRAVNVDGKVYFQMSFADIRNGEAVAIDSGWLFTAEQVVPAVSAVITTFLEFGDFSKRLRSRLKYYVSSVGVGKFKTILEQRMLFKPKLAEKVDDPLRSENGHLGVWKQSDEKLSYIGFKGASGRYTAAQLRGLAKLAKHYGKEVVRLTTLQNCILPHIANGNVSDVLKELKRLGITAEQSFGGAIVACTGNTGCSYSATNTKADAASLETFLNGKKAFTESVNIHFTGCPFSCAQAYIGDIGLLGAKVKGELCYHVFLGGGADMNALAQKIKHAVPVSEINKVIEQILSDYHSQKACGEVFHDYVARLGLEHFQEKKG